MNGLDETEALREGRSRGRRQRQHPSSFGSFLCCYSHSYKVGQKNTHNLTSVQLGTSVGILPELNKNLADMEIRHKFGACQVLAEILGMKS